MIVKSSSDLIALGRTWQVLRYAEDGIRYDASPEPLYLSYLKDQLDKEEDGARALGLLGIGLLALRYVQEGGAPSYVRSFLEESVSSLERSIAAPSTWESCYGTWSLVELAEAGLVREISANTIEKLVGAWLSSDVNEAAVLSGRALEFLPVLDRSLLVLEAPKGLTAGLLKGADGDSYDRPSIIVAYYWGAPWTDEEIVELALRKFSAEPAFRRILESLLLRLGEAGQRGLAQLPRLYPR